VQITGKQEYFCHYSKEFFVSSLVSCALQTSCSFDLERYAVILQNPEHCTQTSLVHKCAQGSCFSFGTCEMFLSARQWGKIFAKK